MNKKYSIIKLGNNKGAVIPIFGEMTIETNKALEETVDNISKDKELKFIILEINSLGGDAEGVHEVAYKIRALNKPVMAYVLQDALSGAYWVTAAADSIHLKNELCAVGSVGVYSTYVDSSAQLINSGLNIEIIKKGKLKAETTGFTSLTEAGKKLLQEKVDLIYEVFYKFVKHCRGGLNDGDLQGQPHYGKKAIQRNFADSICSPIELQIKLFKILSDGV